MDPSVNTFLGFKGERLEQPYGWYHLGNGLRVYNPVTRRFHSPDRLSPFGKGGLNAYTYCVGDPVNFSDPTGHNAVLALVKNIGSRVTMLDVGTRVLLQPSYPGITGIVQAATDLGYGAMVVGAGLRSSGYLVGETVASAGALMVATGKTVLTAKKVVDRLARTSAGKYVRKLLNRPSARDLAEEGLPARLPKFSQLTEVSVIREIGNPAKIKGRRRGTD